MSNWEQIDEETVPARTFHRGDGEEHYMAAHVTSRTYRMRYGYGYLIKVVHNDSVGLTYVRDEDPV